MGDKVVISEINGKTDIKVISKGIVFDSLPKGEMETFAVIKDGQVDSFTGRKIGGDSAPRTVTRILRTHPEEYGFKGDVGDKKSIREWAAAMTKEVIKQNPGVSNIITHDGDELDLTRTPSGGWWVDIDQKGKTFHLNPKEVSIPTSTETPSVSSTPESAPEPAPKPTVESTPTPKPTVEPETEAEVTTPLSTPKFEDTLSEFEIKEASNLPSVIENAFSKEPRFALLSEANKDKFIYKTLIHYIETANTKDNPKEFFEEMKIASGNPFDVAPGKIVLDTALGKKDIDGLFKDVAEGKVSDDVIGLRKKMGKVIADLKDSPIADLNEEMIRETIKGIKE